MNWFEATKDKNQTSIKVVNSKTLSEFNRKTSGNVLTKIVKQKGSIIKKYKNWNSHIKKIMDKCFNKNKIKKETRKKTIEKLYRQKREIKRQYKQIKEKSSTLIRRYKIQKNLINEYIEEEEKK